MPFRKKKTLNHDDLLALKMASTGIEMWAKDITNYGNIKLTRLDVKRRQSRDGCVQMTLSGIFMIWDWNPNLTMELRFEFAFDWNEPTTAILYQGMTVKDPRPEYQTLRQRSTRARVHWNKEWGVSSDNYFRIFDSDGHNEGEISSFDLGSGSVQHDSTVLAFAVREATNTQNFKAA